MSKQGKVFLVGAGPGDIELLTIKGKRVLEQADVIIIDRLVNPHLLMEANNQAKVIYCGKQPCKHTLRQEDIQIEMLIHAKKGKQVVRLKGGDPAVFGRVGEEAAFLKKNGVAYEIVPGVTSGIAASMYAGVPVTHRDYSTSFAVVTGHCHNQLGKPKVNWQALAQSVDTILFYMGISEIETITTELIDKGKSAQTPVLVIQWGTYSRQKTVEGTLSNIHRKVKSAKVKNPAMIVVGDIVSMREKFSWFSQKPYSGWGILTFTKEETPLMTTFRENGADLYRYSLSILKNGEVTMDVVHAAFKASPQQGIVFSETIHVRAFIQKLVELGYDIRELQAPLLAGTTEVLKEFNRYGFQVDFAEEQKHLMHIRIGCDSSTEPLSPVTKMAISRLLEEGHVNALLCESEEELRALEHCFQEIRFQGFSAPLKLLINNVETNAVNHFSEKWNVEVIDLLNMEENLLTLHSI
ncbi:uroporphyrinogen-III C-methyltransferase [Alkalihalobacillus sp. 1P02AB]|uniref:uroporphyrinogen-III C-methyltransferase n=1 Tax=Alkalihalobacillus sp. 1P02AB TaxID=3132260 RepID=UPI0039A47EA9